MGKKQVSVITPGFPMSQVPQFYIVSVGGGGGGSVYEWGRNKLVL